jgi:hypothetical protein
MPSRATLVMALLAALLGLGAGIAVRLVAQPIQPNAAINAAPVVPDATVVAPEATVIVVEAPVVAPTVAPAPTLAPTAAPPVQPPAQPTATRSAPAPSDQFSVLLDERFASNTRGWLDQPNGTAYWDQGGYHLEPRKPGQFVAVSVPGVENVQDVVLSGTFRKMRGPDGGGYGLIVRDQHVGMRDGQTQGGRFYVFEIGDRGELGVWLRDGDKWVDLLPWTASDAVKSGLATNELTVSAIGDRLSFMVNGIPVASQRDAMLERGGLGVFTGGDGNQVMLERLTVRVPR